MSQLFNKSNLLTVIPGCPGCPGLAIKTKS